MQKYHRTICEAKSLMLHLCRRYWKTIIEKMQMNWHCRQSWCSSSLITTALASNTENLIFCPSRHHDMQARATLERPCSEIAPFHPECNLCICCKRHPNMELVPHIRLQLSYHTVRKCEDCRACASCISDTIFAFFLDSRAHRAKS